jgi:hypothetical protein
MKVAAAHRLEVHHNLDTQHSYLEVAEHSQSELVVGPEGSRIPVKVRVEVDHREAFALEAVVVLHRLFHNLLE